MITVTYNEMDYSELDELVQKHFGLADWSCVAENEWSNDESHTFEVEAKLLDEYDQRSFWEALAGKGS